MFKVILANGRSQRFADAGYKVPKHLLPVGDKRVIDVIAETLGDNVAVIGDPKYKSHIDQRPYISLYRSISPLADLLQAPFHDDDELLVNFCDCWMSNPLLLAKAGKLHKAEAAVVTFSSHESRHDQLLPGVAFGGIYWFKSGKVLREIAKKTDTEKATLLTAVMLAKEYTIKNSYDYVDIGVPQDYERFVNRLSNV